MNTERFARFQREKVIEGQHLLAGAVRALVRQRAPDLSRSLSDAGDEPFLEPLLFAWLGSPEPPMDLPQILLGYLDEPELPDAIEIEADRHGRICLPRIGELITEAAGRRLVLRLDREAGALLLWDGIALCDYHFEAPLLVPGVEIELLRSASPLLLSALSVDVEGAEEPVRILGEDEAHGHLGHLARALAIIRACCPDFHQDLTRVVRQIALFQSGELNSCATVAAHGVALLNVREGDDEVFFVDDLVHQCGHVVFNAMTARRGDYFVVDPDTPARELAPLGEDPRSAYTILHGLYTEHVMVQCLRACDERRVFAGRQAHELSGRLSFIARKLAVDLAPLDRPGVLTELGRQVYEVFRAGFDALRRERPEILSRHDLSDQPYVFSYERFARRNPAPRAAA